MYQIRRFIDASFAASVGGLFLFQINLHFDRLIREGFLDKDDVRLVHEADRATE
jgi:hypothetical protein